MSGGGGGNPNPNDDSIYRAAYEVSFVTTLAFALLTYFVATAVRVYRVVQPDTSTEAKRWAQFFLAIPPLYEGVLWGAAVGFTCLTLLIAVPGPYPTIPTWYIGAFPYSSNVVGTGFYFLYWFTFTFMSDALTIFFLFPDPSARSLLYTALATTAWAGLMAGINAAGFPHGGSIAVHTRVASCFIDAAFHAAVLSTQCTVRGRRFVRRTIIPNSVFVFMWRMLTAIFVLANVYSQRYVGSTIVLFRTAGLILMTYLALMLDVGYWRNVAATSMTLFSGGNPVVGVAIAKAGLGASGDKGVAGADARPLLAGEEGAGSGAVSVSASATGVDGGGEWVHCVLGERARLHPELLATATRELLETAGTCWMACPCLISSVRGMGSHVRDIGYWSNQRGYGGGGMDASAMSRDSDSEALWLDQKELDQEIHESQLVTSAREINDGTYGRVYAGLWGKKLVAIKIFKQTMTNRHGQEEFNKERQELLRMRDGHYHHPCMVRYYGYCLCLDRMSLVFELCEYGSLQHVIEINRNMPTHARPLTLVRILRILCDTAAALAYMHNLHWVHRDLKPDNILITRNFNAKLGDLGTSRQVAVEMTVNVGTPLYRAPEGMSNNRDHVSAVYGAACDMYAMGLIIWAIMHMECNPYPGFTQERQLAVAVIRGLRPEVNDAAFAFPGGEQLKGLMRALWDGEPARRPTAVQALGALEAVARASLTHTQLAGMGAEPPHAPTTRLGSTNTTSRTGSDTVTIHAGLSSAPAIPYDDLSTSRTTALQRSALKAGPGGASTVELSHSASTRLMREGSTIASMLE